MSWFIKDYKGKNTKKTNIREDLKRGKVKFSERNNNWGGERGIRRESCKKGDFWFQNPCVKCSILCNHIIWSLIMWGGNP
jgi:hypothetical protein